VRLAKQSLRAGLTRTLAQCLAAETEAQAECWASPDSAEGIRAFVEKRKATFGAGKDVAPEAAAHRFE
jgi:enoyl-CoA hydratase/carnithine racemase